MCSIITGQFQISPLNIQKKKIAAIQLSDYVSSDGHLEMSGLGSFCNVKIGLFTACHLWNMCLYQGGPLIRQLHSDCLSEEISEPMFSTTTSHTSQLYVPASSPAATFDFPGLNDH